MDLVSWQSACTQETRVTFCEWVIPAEAPLYPAAAVFNFTLRSPLLLRPVSQKGQPPASLLSRAHILVTRLYSHMAKWRRRKQQVFTLACQSTQVFRVIDEVRTGLKRDRSRVWGKPCRVCVLCEELLACTCTCKHTHMEFPESQFISFWDTPRFETWSGSIMTHVGRGNNKDKTYLVNQNTETIANLKAADVTCNKQSRFNGSQMKFRH